MSRAATTGDWLSLLALTAMWGTSFALNELALRAFTPAAIVLFRVAVGTVVLYSFLRLSGVGLPRHWRDWLPMGVMAVLGNVLPFQLIAWGQQSVTSSVAGVLMAVTPLFVLTLAHFFIPGDRLTPSRLLGFALGFVGVALVIGPESLSHLTHDTAVLGSLAVLAAALSYAVNSVYARRLGATHPTQLAVGMLIVATLLSLPSTALEGVQIAQPGVGAIIAIALLGTLSTGLATVLYFRVIQGPGPTFLSIVNYLVPAWAVAIGVIFLDESLTVAIGAGLVLILAGIAIGEVRWSTPRGASDPLLTSRSAATDEQ